MPSYRITAYNDFETPSGAVGEAPDGPGAFQHVMDQVDARLGFGGAEYCATTTAMTAIPSSRLFIGKLAFVAASGTVYRYVGAGNTGVVGDSTSAWLGWEKPATSFTPVWPVGLTVGSSTQVARWGISAGVLWVEIAFTAGASYVLSAGSDVQLTPPGAVLGSMGGGSGQYQKAGSAAANSQVDLAAYAIGTAGQSSTAIRVRAKFTNAAPGAVTANILGSVVTATTTDTFQVSFRGPSAVVA